MKYNSFYKNIIKNLLDFKEEGIINIILDYQSDLENNELIKYFNKDITKNTFESFKNFLLLFENILSQNLDLKDNTIRSYLFKSINNLNFLFNNFGLNYFNEYKKLKEENQILKQKNKRLTEMCQYFNIVDIDSDDD